MIEIRDTEYIRTKEVDGTVISCVRAEIDCDTADDLPAVDCIQGCELIAGSIAWDISTGDFYGLGSDGTWKKQNSGGGSGTVEFFEVDIEFNESSFSISKNFADIKEAVQSGKIISGEFTIPYTQFVSTVRGGFDENLSSFDDNGCVVLYVDPFDTGGNAVFFSLIITSEDEVYFAMVNEWSTANTRGKNNFDFANLFKPESEEKK
ncbi:MAG: hypothetical protein J6Y71_07520 [Ruminococcus sp.]|nr:hypothetical protein [Ruminococcus sp.]